MPSGRPSIEWVESKRSNPELQQRAEAVLAEIERDATTRRDAIAALLGDESAPQAPRTEGSGGQASKRPSRAKGGEPAPG